MAGSWLLALAKAPNSKSQILNKFKAQNPKFKT